MNLAKNIGHRPGRHFYYGWVIVAVSFITLFLAMGTRFTFGVYYIAILEEYGWGRAETAGAFSLAMVFHAFFAPVSGILVDRFGPRKLFPIAATFLFFGLLAASRISAIWHLYVFFGVLMAMGINTLSYSPVMSIIPKWFIRKRGLASGLALSGVGLGTLVLVPFNALMIDTLGWRSAFCVLSGIILFFLVPVTALFYRSSPMDIGQYPNGEIQRKDEHALLQKEKNFPPPNIHELWTLGTAIRVRAFWFMVLAVICDAFVVNMLLVHQAVYIVDIGCSKLLAASTLGLVGLLRSLGGILFGFLSDYIGRRKGYYLGSILFFVGIIILLYAREVPYSWTLYAFSIIYGLGCGSKSTMLAAITGDLFPGNSLGRIMSIQSTGFGIGGAMGAYLGGYFYDQMGTYVVSFLLSLGIIIFSVFSIWIATSRSQRGSDQAKCFI